ncbi:hypothetical protein [Sphingomicrobium lutaoense]|uniref:Uncharacterized protein n=1 Tax=Sphingomicrobium lutaoense TaxID=515949 RepID=A0A839Z1A1_9SPHN|nr:hypothetical protein [Sphingomicrobium lutaoense]MBB3765026.1 hypothetical protein [Sphingomicrobium lutaoense]
MRKYLAAALSIGLLAAPAAAKQQNATPTGQWVVDVSDAGCTVFREFSAGKEQYFLHVNRYAGDPAMELVVLHKDKLDNEVYRVTGDLVIDDGESALSPEVHRIAMAGGFMRFGVTMDPASHPLGHVDDSLSLHAGRLIDVRLATGPMGRPLEALESCVASEMDG